MARNLLQVDYIRERLLTLSWRETSIIILSCMIVYLFKAESTYKIQPVWRKMLGNRDSEVTYDTASPLVTDIESDGVNEILVITNDLQLVVMAMPDIVDVSSQILPHMTIRKSVQLNLGRRRWPTVLTAGYLEPYLSMVQVRKQVIAIVTSELEVQCYDHDLTLLWSTQLLPLNQSHDAYYMNSAAAIVTSVSTKKATRGLVIVGASFSHKSHQKQQSRQHKHTSEDHKLTDFSTFALSGADGSIVWKNTPGEESREEDKMVEENVVHWKLSVKRQTKRTHRNSGWSKDLAKHLPHSWSTLRDTSIQLSNAAGPSQRSNADTTTSAVLALGQRHISGYAYGGFRPHSPQEHVAHPDTVVIHHSRGVHVLALSSGAHLVNIELSDHRSVYVDLGHDAVRKLRLEAGGSHDDCTLDIHPMTPQQPPEVVRVAMCRRGWHWWATHHREDVAKSIPRVVPSLSHRPGILQHLRGDNLIKQNSEYDLLLHLSSGRVVSLSRDGFVHWEVVTKSSWNTAAPSDPTNKHKLASFTPDLRLFSLSVFGEQRLAVVTGWDHISLVDLHTGAVLSQHSIPCQPLSRVVVGDFDNNGLNDFIITCDIGYIGFTVTPQPQHVWTVVYAASVFVSILLLTSFMSYVQQTDAHDD